MSVRKWDRALFFFQFSQVSWGNINVMQLAESGLLLNRRKCIAPVLKWVIPADMWL